MNRLRTALVVWVGAAVVGLSAQAGPPASGNGASVTIRNPIDLARPGETVVLAAADIKKALAVDDLRRVYVRDDAAGREALAQAVDTNDDGTFDELVFQADIAAGETRTFTLSVGTPRVYTRDQFKAFGRFVRERRDDYAWENDRVAFRMYGAALETWAQEPLTSSTVDMWFKRTRRLVINEWYMVDDYHRDLGEGADLYSAGKSRGCGGNGVWEGGRLWPSVNFRDSRSLANGPIRVMFELVYAAWDVNGRPVRERKRVTLDAGQHLSRFESTYQADGTQPAVYGAGIKKQAGSVSASNLADGILRSWEPVKDNGNVGCGIVVAPGSAVEVTEADGNYLIVSRVPATGPAAYYAGFGWDRSGDIKDVADWDRYLKQAAERQRAPVLVSVRAR